MTFVLNDQRRSVLDEPGHVLVLGGPGAGKTTLAILKAQAGMPAMKPGQTALFLSFSRAAVHQIITRCKTVLSREELSRIEVRTYHSFCWELLKGHGRVLRGSPIAMISPGQEGMMRTQFEGDWEVERRRLLDEESQASFDAFAHAAARLIEESRHIRDGIADIHPLIILDEFQDTDDDQWRLVQALAEATKSVFLADPEQRIYDFRKGVRTDRLDILRRGIKLLEADLEADNFRSPTSDVLRFANAVVTAKAPGRSKDVIVTTYERFQNMFNSTVHFYVGQAFADLARRGVAEPCVAVLATSNDLVADISELLSTSHNFGKNALSPISHDVVWDGEQSSAAALVTAALLEQTSAYSVASRTAALRRVADFWLLKKDWCEQQNALGAKTAGDRAARMTAAIDSLRRDKPIRASGPNHLAQYQRACTGDPVSDWRLARQHCTGHDDLRAIAVQAAMVRLSKAGDPIAMALSELWARTATYAGAVERVTAILDQQRLVGADRPPRGCILMTIHKSKGKEFDAVVIVEGYRGGALLKEDEAPKYENSRRVLRVGITRARYAVRIIRPVDPTPFFDPK
ncbi:UvrD-helicase domain-containing protein [Methylocystis rosea]|uniref:ATP-dependent helicase n=1 Tax=Methylocystis rosea TaxID=173366 RepID=A0A3G8M7V2_9HYPH|nr:UvrD-helicase domain-containing protein [Methylocystis rosea]AZG77180.1 ATP-dependent helicase [Methylocystis rosea]